MQCCMCVVGVFMFLGGVIMLATGISLILNYGVFDITLLPPDLNNEEGKKTVGIILTVCGLLAIIVSVIVSVLYLCNKTKPSVNPDDLSRIPGSSGNNTPDRPDLARVRGDRRSSNPSKPNYAANGGSRAQPLNKHIPGSAEVKLPRSTRKGRHRKIHRQHRRLEEIKEDAVSRKTVDAALVDRDLMKETESMSSQFTIDENSKVPKVVLDDYNDRPPSVSSTSTSIFSETSSNYRFLDNDKSRRELQFMPDSVRSRDYSSRPPEAGTKDPAYFEQCDETSLLGKNDEEFSVNSDGLVNPSHEFQVSSQSPADDNRNSAGGTREMSSAESSLPNIPDTAGNITSYKASHYTEVHGEQTVGRISPQIGEPETYTDVTSGNKFEFTRSEQT